MKKPHLFFILISILMLSACGIKQVDKTKTWSASKLYIEARSDLASGAYESAIQLYETLQARFPYSQQARQAEIETIYAYYRYQEIDSAISTADRFINEHPDHPNLDYVYYMRGIINYGLGEDLLSKLFPQNPAERDPKSLRNSFKYFAELIATYPNSKYSKDALARMTYIRNKLAEHELHIARFYFKRDAYVATVNRAKVVVENFQETTAVPEALHLLKDAYTKMNLTQLANTYQRLIERNHLQKYERVTYTAPGIIQALLRAPK